MTPLRLTVSQRKLENIATAGFLKFALKARSQALHNLIKQPDRLQTDLQRVPIHLRNCTTHESCPRSTVLNHLGPNLRATNHALGPIS